MKRLASSTPVIDESFGPGAGLLPRWKTRQRAAQRCPLHNWFSHAVASPLGDGGRGERR